MLALPGIHFASLDSIADVLMRRTESFIYKAKISQSRNYETFVRIFYLERTNVSINIFVFPELKHLQKLGL